MATHVFPSDRYHPRSHLHREDPEWQAGYRAGRHERWLLTGAGGGLIGLLIGHRHHLIVWVLALQRRHVDLLHGTINIEQAWVVPMSGKPMIGPPKTKAGVRVLAIPPNVVPAVVDHLERFVSSEPTAWLFGTSSGTALSPRNFNRAWDKARRVAGRPDLHLHDLRIAGSRGQRPAVQALPRSCAAAVTPTL